MNRNAYKGTFVVDGRTVEDVVDEVRLRLERLGYVEGENNVDSINITPKCHRGQWQATYQVNFRSK